MNELVEIVGLTKSYDARNVAVNNITITLPKGKIVGLLGPNGSGKTTLIKMMNGLLTPSQGSIRINGHPVGVETKAMWHTFRTGLTFPAGSGSVRF